MPRDQELLKRWRPEPATQRETRAMETLEHGDFEIYRNKFELVCWEAYQMFSRMGVSPMIEAGDAAIGIYTRQGDLAVGIMGTQLHLINASIGIKWTMRHFFDEPTVGIREGDMFYVNDALYGGIHNSDQILYMPVFREGELVAWVAAASHETETGAKEPGGNPPSAQSRYDEGLILSPIRIGEKYQLRADQMEMMENRVRDPRMQTLDIKARVTGCHILEKRLHEVMDARGTDFVVGAMRRMIDEGVEAARAKVASMNDGVYRQVLFLENAGADKYGLLRCMIEAEKRGDQCTIRFYGSPRVELGNFNMFPHMMVAQFACYLYQFLFHELPATTGFYEAFRFEFQNDTFFQGDPEDATSLGVATQAQVLTGVHTVMEKMKYGSGYGEYVTAGWPGTSSTTAVAGMTPEGQIFAAWDQGQPNGVGMGARWDSDGPDAAGFIWCAIGEFLDTEPVEDNYPIIALVRSKYWKDAAGFGKFRGGRSMNALYRVHGTPMVYAAAIGGMAGRPVAPGLFGGYPSRPVAFAILRNNNLDELAERGELPQDIYEAVERVEADWDVRHSNSGMTEFYEGDCWLAMAPSGPGYGDPLDRDPELVVKDLREESISARTATEIYKVVYHEDSLKADHEATALARKEEREARIARAVPFEEWESQWSRRRPPESVMQYYGWWPHGTPGTLMFSNDRDSEHYLEEDVREGRRQPHQGL